jgi:predicted ATPase
MRREELQHREAAPMISELKIRNFKSLESVDLKLGHFNLLVGANASGKSNFLDALRFLQGSIGNPFPLNTVLGGIPASGTINRWDGIRGGVESFAFRRKGASAARVVSFQVFLSAAGGEDLEYSLTVDPSALTFASEEVRIGSEIVHEMNRAEWERRTDDGIQPPYVVSSVTNTFANMLFYENLREHAPLANGGQSEIDEGWKRKSNLLWRIIEPFRDAQFLDPLPAVLRDYSPRADRLGENGEGFAALIHEIESNGSKPALLEWLKELRPDEVDDIYALEGLNNDFMVAIREGNEEYRAPALSEGTLRFIALAAAFFQPSMPKVLVIEEIEKGLHPSRLRLLLELVRSQSKRTGTQVFATTHSPTLLAWLNEEDRKTTFVCTRDAESGATKMRSLAEIPRFEELLHEGSHIDELFAEGWLESAPQ